MIKLLAADALRWRVPEGALDFSDTREVAASDGIIGQEVALDAIRQGVRMERPGYNIFVSGVDSGGRLRTIERVLQGLHPRRRQRRDFVYVRNLKDPSRPSLLTLPAGQGPALRKALAALRDRLFDEIPRVLESDPVRAGRDRLVREMERGQRSFVLGLQDRVSAEGFAVGEDGDGDESNAVIVYVFEEDPVSRAEVHVLAHQGKLDRPIEEIEAIFDRLEDDLAHTLAEARSQGITTHTAVAKLEAEAVGAGIGPLFKEHCGKFSRARAWLAELQAEVVDTYDAFREEADEEMTRDLGVFAAFSVNLLHRGSRSRKAPIVLVSEPTFGNLFGGVVHESGMGRPADHMSLRPGALFDADGGYLVLNANDLITEPGAWKTLKRGMLFGELGVQNLEGAVQGAAAPLRPEPVPLDVKIVMLGEDMVYTLFHSEDPDFRSIFKIKAEFEDDCAVTNEVIGRIASFLVRMGRREGLREMTAGGVGALIERFVRESGRANHIRLAFGEITDLYREADDVGQGELIGSSDIVAALAARVTRQGQVERHIVDAMRRDTLHIATTGSVIGQINGLAVYVVGGHEFGRPLRITATAGAGRAGVVNIERESGLSGTAHDKGVHVLTGFLRSHFGRTRTLALAAGICVEQHFGMIDGDSASSAELYALISALSGVALRQDRAVTGSVDQLGAIQPIGGVNEKIEGFYRLCAERGLTGEQGVLIPARNVADLCLADDVYAACAAGRFHVWAVDRVEDGLALLTDRNPGQRPGVVGAEDAPAKGTIYARLGDTLDAFEQVVRRARAPM